MTQLRQKYPFSYLFRSFSFQLQFSLVLCLFLTLKTHLFHLLTYEKEITKDFSVYCKRTKRQHNTRKKTKSKFHCFILWFQFFELYIWIFIHEMRRNPTYLILVHFILFKSSPIFHLFDIVCWFSSWKWRRKKFGDEKYETEWYKILRKKRSESKQGFETSSSSSENEKKSTDSVSINFLLEILIFNFFF